MSQSNFADAYYLEIVDKNAGEQDLHRHQERFKKLLNNPESRSPERIASYRDYFFQRYRSDGKYTYDDKKAAWDMYVELNTSIATRRLEGGDIETALSRLASLFNFHRETLHKHGFGCRYYSETVNEVFEEKLRHFTAKWHGQLDLLRESAEQEKCCREELANIQNVLLRLKNKLDDICR